MYIQWESGVRVHTYTHTRVDKCAIMCVGKCVCEYVCVCVGECVCLWFGECNIRTHLFVLSFSELNVDSD